MEGAEKHLHKRLPKFIFRVKNYLYQNKIPARFIFLLIGFLSTLWFLFRVIPKPSRATYPCMKAAYPFMSCFAAYIIGLATTIFAFRKSKNNFIDSKYLASAAFLLLAVFASIFTLTSDSIPVYANSKLLLTPNQPIGTAKGIYPGRVVWVWDSSATNENIPRDTTKIKDQIYGEGWFLPKHTNMDVVNTMVADAVKKLAGKETVNESWDELFKYYNKTHSKGNIGYQSDEKIFIRTNQVSASSGTYDNSTFEIKEQSRYGMAETSPQVVLAILRQLINEYGVKQENISVGDPMKHMYKHVFDMWKNEFPNIVCIDSDARLGRTAPVSSADPSIYYSDRGKILKTSGTSGDPVTSDYFPTVITDADYLIVIPSMKAHARGGVTLTAKIHFGSNLRGSATHLHGGLVAPDKMSTTSTLRPGYGLYRVQVDLMGSEKLGGKTVLFIVDALWGGSEANDPPRKFSMTPFNNDWTSSVFVSQDQVAIESVCFDFLKAEFTEDNPYGSYPQMEGADDYILQAADSNYWPTDIKYDPENDGTTIGSLGVCEHWNNPIDKKYSRNLGIGDGIELIEIDKTVTAVEDILMPQSFTLYQNYPNPFNPSTKISYKTVKAGIVKLTIYDIIGEEVTQLVNSYQSAGNHEIIWNAKDDGGRSLVSGIYFASMETGSLIKTIKLMLLK